MTSQYATPFRGETQDEKKLRILKGMRFLVKRNPKKYRMRITEGVGNIVLEEVADVINFRWSPPHVFYREIQTIKIHSGPRDRTSKFDL